jgi:AraC-like DNA-binding protein
MDGRIAAVLSLMERDSRLDIPALAMSVHLSPSRLRCLFHTEIAISLHKYMKRQRLLRARHLLATTFLSVKEVADVSGFGDLSHFVRDFRKAFAVSPRGFRRAVTSANEQAKSPIAWSSGRPVSSDRGRSASFRETEGGTAMHRKLKLSAETNRVLSDSQARRVVGGRR